MDDPGLQSSGDDPVEDSDSPYDGAGTPTQEDGHFENDREDSASSVSANSTIVSGPDGRELGLDAVKGLGASGLIYDDYE